MTTAAQGQPTAFLFDLGSTFTKGVAVRLETGEILARHQTPSTVDSDVRSGLKMTLEELAKSTTSEPVLSLASSSAAGGLGMVAIGLVPELTGEAARLTALGAGAKVLASLGYKLTTHDRDEIDRRSPDIILLAGGTDGGEEEVPLHNARLLTDLPPTTIVFAGNRVIADQVERILTTGHHSVVVTENVLPRLDAINADPAQMVIRDIFLDRIVHAKGLDRAKELVDDIIMPTPAAVLKAVETIHRSSEGSSDLLLVDVGGATTDVVSASEGTPTEPGLIPTGLKDPFYKRTVEGDLGLRHNADVIVASIGLRNVAQRTSTDEEAASRYLGKIAEDASYIPADDTETAMDVLLSQVAVRVAASRHAGQLEPVLYTQGKDLFRLRGKDLRDIKMLIGTGGIFTSPAGPEILRSALFDENHPESLRPKTPTLLVDTRYVMYAVGLLASRDEGAAMKLALSSLREVGSSTRAPRLDPISD